MDLIWACFDMITFWSLITYDFIPLVLSMVLSTESLLCCFVLMRYYLFYYSSQVPMIVRMSPLSWFGQSRLDEY
jgi:hypothetical protein